MYSTRHDRKIILEMIKMFKTIMAAIRQTQWPLQSHDLKEMSAYIVFAEMDIEEWFWWL